MMPILQVTTRSGENHSVPAAAHASAMEAIRDSGVADLVAMCGGCCACATCHVYVEASWLDKLEQPGEDEDDMMSDLAHRRPNSRLSCQIIITDALDGLPLTVAPEE